MSPSFSVNSRLLGNLGVTYLGISYLGGRNPNYLEQVALPNLHQPKHLQKWANSIKTSFKIGPFVYITNQDKKRPAKMHTL